MPLKHTTETLLVFLLGTAIVVTGIVIPSLTTLEMGIAPWAIVFVLAAAYPLALSRLFKRNRADYSFRLLHWVPAALLLILLLVQGAVYFLPLLRPILDWYTWGWALPGVATGFFLLVYFCLRVIRRWTKRVALLTLLFVPFMAGAVVSEHYEWNAEIASALWGSEWWKWETGEGTMVAQVDSSEQSSEKNLDASIDPAEESYRERLRAIENRRERIAARLEERRMAESMEEEEEEESSSEGMVAMEEESSSSSVSSATIRQVSSMPATLPSSGFGWAAIILLLLSFYMATVHARSRERLAEMGI